MKILLYAKSIADAHLAHALAVHLREGVGATAFAAVVYRGSAEGYYLRHETEGCFNPVLSESEMVRAGEKALPNAETLARLEGEYGIPTLWQYVTHDRWLYMTRRGYLFEYGSPHTREYLLAQVQARFLEAERLFDEFNPDLVLYAGRDVGPSSALIVSKVAEARGVPVIVPKHTKIGSYHVLNDRVTSRMPAVEARLEELRRGAPSPNREHAQRFLEAFRGKGVAPSFTSKPKLRRDADAAKWTRRVSGYARKRASGDPLYASWFRRRADAMTISLRRSILRRKAFLYTPRTQQRFVLFPLHLEPELSLLLYAPFWTNQFAVIQNLAQSLPQDMCLYVKEHPTAFGKRTIAYYEQLSRIPNVRVLEPGLNALELIQRAEGVITITGTAGMEAMLLGKPVITLGDVFYNAVRELVWHSHSMEEIPALVARFRSFESNESLVLDYVTALLDESIELDLEALAVETHMAKPGAAGGHAAPSPELLKYVDFLAAHIQSVALATSIKHNAL